MLPFMEQSALYTQITSGFTDKSGTYRPFGSAPWVDAYAPCTSQVGFFRCPSDPTKKSAVRSPINAEAALARTNYAFCLGDSEAGASSYSISVSHTRGVFENGIQHTLAAVTDGTSNTIMFGEIATSPTLSVGVNVQTLKTPKVHGYNVAGKQIMAPFPVVDIKDCKSKVRGGTYIGNAVKGVYLRGARWTDAVATYTGFNTIIAPNGATCFSSWSPQTFFNARPGSGEIDGVFTAGSYHIGGAHVAMFDNAVKFIPSEIDTTDPANVLPSANITAPGRQPSGNWTATPNWTAPSPFGIWGALGTAASGESLSESPL